MGAYLARCTKPKSIVSLDKRPKKQISQGQRRRNSSIPRSFGSTSVCDMDNSALQSQRCLSSINISSQALDKHASVSNSNPPSEFVNHGLLLWNQTRQCWIGNKKQTRKGRDPKLSWNTTYESLLGNNKPFSRPVPLAEMVDFLVDTWEQEGMYD